MCQERIRQIQQSHHSYKQCNDWFLPSRIQRHSRSQWCWQKLFSKDDYRYNRSVLSFFDQMCNNRIIWQMYTTGMYKPTHGHIYLKGRDYNEDGSSIDPIGYCPQENILVNYLTTIQHLYIFGMVNIYYFCSY
jgi:hypothetical protein